MMRWLLAVLVLANVALFMWGSWYKDADLPQRPLTQVDINPMQMRLISDPSVKLEPRKPNRPPAMETLQPVQRACHAVGAFSSTRSAMNAGMRLKKVGLEYSLRTEQSTEISYQVYIPPLKSRAEARALQARLNHLGFKDNALMQQTGMNNAISLGWFKVKANAIQLQRALKRKGIRSKRRTIKRVRSRFWLDVPTDDSKLALLKGIKWKQKNISVRDTTCAHGPTTASVAGARPK